MTPSEQRVMEVLRSVKAIWPICLQVTLATVGVGGVSAIATRTARGQRGVVRRVKEDRVRLAPRRGAAGQR